MVILKKPQRLAVRNMTTGAKSAWASVETATVEETAETATGRLLEKSAHYFLEIKYKINFTEGDFYEYTNTP